MRRDDSTAERLMLEERVFSVKKRFLAMYRAACAGHIGSSLSCAEILVLLKFGWMREKDTFVLSKGHAAAALYALLAEAGSITPSQIESFYREGTQLAALPPFNVLPEIPFATGSLGYGLSVSAGMALGAVFGRPDAGEPPKRFFCVTSDGELDEGSVWEAALFIAHRKLTNVVWVIDRNRIQAVGRTEDVLALEPLDEKLRAFGYHVVSADGHDFGSLLSARDQCISAIEARGMPVVIIANTVKGNGVSYMHDTVDCHYLPMSDTQYTQAVEELTRAHESRMNELRACGPRSDGVWDAN